MNGRTFGKSHVLAGIALAVTLSTGSAAFAQCVGTVTGPGAGAFGPQFNAIAQAALHERESSGKGQFVDISMLDCQVAVMENSIMRYFVTGEVPGPLGTRHPSATPFQAFPTADGQACWKR